MCKNLSKSTNSELNPRLKIAFTLSPTTFNEPTEKLQEFVPIALGDGFDEIKLKYCKAQPSGSQLTNGEIINNAIVNRFSALTADTFKKKFTFYYQSSSFLNVPINEQEEGIKGLMEHARKKI